MALSKLKDVAEKLVLITELVSESLVATVQQRREELYLDYWLLIDQLRAIEAATLLPWRLQGYPPELIPLQTHADRLYGLVVYLTKFSRGVGGEVFFSVTDGTLLPLTMQAQPPRDDHQSIDEKCASIVPKRNKRAAETWQRLLFLVQQQLSQPDLQSCYAAIAAATIENRHASDDWLRTEPPPSDWHQECLIGSQKQLLKCLGIQDAEAFQKLCREGDKFWVIREHRTKYLLYCRHKSRFDSAKQRFDNESPSLA